MAEPRNLSKEFFLNDAKLVAPKLLGKTLCVRLNDGSIKKTVISETEAYDGEHDLACHASRGRTPRTTTMYSIGGICYVYLCYGMHWMLNFVTGSEGYPAAVLVRESLEIKGPGRLTKYLGIDDSFNGMDICSDSSVWIEDTGLKPNEIFSGPRVGVNYAGPVWSKKPYRFWFSKH